MNADRLKQRAEQLQELAERYSIRVKRNYRLGRNGPVYGTDRLLSLVVDFCADIVAELERQEQSIAQLTGRN